MEQKAPAFVHSGWLQFCHWARLGLINSGADSPREVNDGIINLMLAQQILRCHMCDV